MYWLLVERCRMNKFESWKSCLSTKVIARSNEDEPLVVGELVGFSRLGGTHLPEVESGGKTYIYMGVVVPFSEELFEMLSKVDPKRQWEILSEISLAIQINRNKE
jgi:hypothetical protein